MNNILNKNIEALSNQIIKDELSNYIYNEKPILTMTNGYNLSYHNIYLHSIENPLLESQQIYASSDNDDDKCYTIIYGLGLGYLFQLAAQGCKGIVLLYEPNMDIMHEAFSLVDFSNEIAKKNVYIFNDIDKLLEFISETTTQESNVQILSLPNYRKMDEIEFNKNAKNIELAFSSVILDYSFKQQKLSSVSIKTIKNIPQLLKEIPINEFENLYKGQTAIVVSAGPTLSENIDILKKYQNHAIIFAVGPALKTLIKNNIRVDFLCMIESNNISKQVYGIDLSNINLIVEPFTNINVHKLKAKNILLHVSENMPPSKYFADIANISATGYLTQGTVSFTALNSAVMMGFNKIVLVGQDLAYIEGQCYAKGSSYEDLVCKLNNETKKYEIVAKDFDKYMENFARKNPEKKREVALDRLKRLNDSLYSVRGIDGNMLPTEAGYASFIIHFVNYAKSLSGIRLINSSLKGALIEGFENVSLEDAMNDSKLVERCDILSEYKYDIKSIVDKLYGELDKIVLSKNVIDNSKKILSRLNMMNKRDKTVNKEKLLKIRELLENYANLNSDTNVLFKYATASEEMIFNEIYSKITSYNDITFPQALAALKKYFEDSEKRIECLQQDLVATIEEIK